MECTQRIECTQQLFQNPHPQERIFPEQIGFLGICGTKYPIRKGPNKIGRDPGTCDIVINLNSVSRQHAVINILNSNEFMIMDLGSANKTKLREKTLQPYIAHPLKNGDTVQFGQIFGVFILLEDDNDLPLTQAIEIPDTPVLNKHASKLKNFPTTIIPESPDVSDKEDSFVAPSQPKNRNVFKSPAKNLIKPLEKTLEIQALQGSKKIDNVYWNSSKKSISMDMGLDESDTDIIHCPTLKSAEAKEEQNIHEMDTQVPFPPSETEDCDALYAADTQLYADSSLASNKENLKTNVPKNNSNQQITDKQTKTEVDLYVGSKENINSIYNADSQQLKIAAEGGIKDPKSTKNVFNSFEETSKASLAVFDEEILFQEVDIEPLEEDFGSQPLLFPESFDGKETFTNLNVEIPIRSNINKNNTLVEIGENKSKNCEDFDLLPTQQITSVKQNTSTSAETIVCNNDKIITSNLNLDMNDDSTDCEDELIDNMNKVNMSNKVAGPDGFTHNKDKILPDSDTLTAINTSSDTQKKAESMGNVTDNLQVHKSRDLILEDMPTQVIEEVDNQNDVNNFNNPKESCLEDLPTPVLEVDTFEEVFKQKEISEEKSPFKVPFQSINNTKRKESTNNSLNTSKRNILRDCEDNDEYFYAATQDVFNDLCSQKELSTEKMLSNIENAENAHCFSKKVTDVNDDKFSKSQRNNQIEEYHVNIEQTPKEQKPSSRSNSDVDSTPEKSQKNTFLKTEPPDSQEIVKTITLNSRALVTESLSDSEQENSTTEQNTPILFHKRKRHKNIKLDLMKNIEVDILPSRAITRKRKPTAKVQNNSPEIQNAFENILRPKIFRGQEEIYDKDIIATNISRIKSIKSKEDKKKSHQNDSTKAIQTKPNQTEESDKIDKVNKTDKTSEKSRHTQNSKKSRTDTQEPITEGRKSKRIEINDDSTKQKQTPKNDVVSQRSSRTKQKKEDNDNKTKPISDVSKVTTLKSKSKRSYVEEAQDESPEKEVRRSKRQKTTKKDIETEINSTKQAKNNKTKQDNGEPSQNQDTYEKSRVYRLSDESASSTPKSLKVSLTEEVDFKEMLRKPVSKNTTTHKVLFTAFSKPEALSNMLGKLGAVIVTDVTTCTVVLTMELKRTFKLLCAVGLGKPIVGKSWVHASHDANMIVDPWLYLLKDEQSEKRFNFSLERTLTGKRNFLKGYNVSSTPSVEPPTNEMKLIVKCSGGTWKQGGPRWICISNVQDKALWPSLKRKGAVIVHPEFVLGGVLRQNLEIEENKL